MGEVTVLLVFVSRFDIFGLAEKCIACERGLWTPSQVLLAYECVCVIMRERERERERDRDTEGPSHL